MINKYTTNKSFEKNNHTYENKFKKYIHKQKKQTLTAIIAFMRAASFDTLGRFKFTLSLLHFNDIGWFSYVI